MTGFRNWCRTQAALRVAAGNRNQAMALRQRPSMHVDISRASREGRHTATVSR